MGDREKGRWGQESKHEDAVLLGQPNVSQGYVDKLMGNVLASPLLRSLRPGWT